MIDTGMGVASLVEELHDVFDKPVTAVATHGHDDHIGGHHEFDDVVAHALGAPLLHEPALDTLETIAAWGPEAVAGHVAAGYALDDPYLVTALPEGTLFSGDALYDGPLVAGI